MDSTLRFRTTCFPSPIGGLRHANWQDTCYRGEYQRISSSVIAIVRTEETSRALGEGASHVLLRVFRGTTGGGEPMDTWHPTVEEALDEGDRIVMEHELTPEHILCERELSSEKQKEPLMPPSN